MTAKHPSCRAIEVDLVVTATGDAESRSAERVHRHLDGCAPCREEFGRYRAVDQVARGLRAVPAPEAVAQSRAGLERSEEHTSELQSPCNLVCRLLLEKKKQQSS